MTKQKQPHKGEIWRKQGPIGWLRINRNETPEATNYDGGAPGFAVSFGKCSFKRERMYWHSFQYFVLALGYKAFVAQMKAEGRYVMQGKVKEQRNEL